MLHRHAPGAGPPGASPAPVTDELGTRSVDAKRPRRLCVPADLGGGVAEPAVGLRSYEAHATRVC